MNLIFKDSQSRLKHPCHLALVGGVVTFDCLREAELGNKV